VVWIMSANPNHPTMRMYSVEEYSTRDEADTACAQWEADHPDWGDFRVEEVASLEETVIARTYGAKR